MFTNSAFSFAMRALTNTVDATNWGVPGMENGMEGRRGRERRGRREGMEK